MFQKLFFLLSGLFMIIHSSSSQSAQNHQYLLVGTYTNTGSKGIYVLDMDMETGEMTDVSHIESQNPSYLALHGNRLYAVNEVGSDLGGGISSYQFDRKTGRLKFLNRQHTGGNDPCYVAVSQNGQLATVANYSGGSIAVFPILKDGALGNRSQLLQHRGKGVDPQRQEKPHVHCTKFTPDGRFVLSADLGLDKVFVYETDPARERLKPAASPFAETGAGSGPRHIAISKSGEYVYVINELDGRVLAFSHEEGRLKQIQNVLLSNDGQTKNMDGADIHISPDGRFLYASSRNKVNTITTYSIGADGKLEQLAVTDVQGDHPRNFTIDKEGKFLIVANKNTNEIVVFKRDSETGLLTDSGVRKSIPQPVCLILTDR